jgi:NIMA (never in mitosis gene a)-related kinase
MTAHHPPFLANDLNSLKKKVISGQYDRIPKFYSEDLENFIRLCLTTNIYERMSAENLIHCNYIRKRVHLYPEEKFNHESFEKVINTQKRLLETIKTPFNKNFKALHARLPRSNYEIDNDFVNK